MEDNKQTVDVNVRFDEEKIKKDIEVINRISKKINETEKELQDFFKLRGKLLSHHFSERLKKNLVSLNLTFEKTFLLHSWLEKMETERVKKIDSEIQKSNETKEKK